MREEDVLRLDVPVHPAGGVQRGERVRDLQRGARPVTSCAGSSSEAQSAGAPAGASAALWAGAQQGCDTRTSSGHTAARAGPGYTGHPAAQRRGLHRHTCKRSRGDSCM